jgi:hypothetical protein
VGLSGTVLLEFVDHGQSYGRRKELQQHRFQKHLNKSSFTVKLSLQRVDSSS